ncbi:hypothetical protein KY495_02935 [Massilia sp. PAMC28688]|uniref:hypothetical protein n=1 Tax=Massilia sp. PAMC28688 TaxID=2861283 RepID=UPI001C635B27|nr:hypothetical protein [Massilia sp. PAMC28688]QYF94199.1 hypothetical protein KY495_02935 [Massilia sp. PAMC28688]
MTKPLSVPHILSWFLAAALATLLAIALVFLAVNWHDRAPSAGARRLEQVSQSLPTVAPADNAFIYLLGIDAPQGQDPRVIGRARFTWLQQQAQANGAARVFPDGLDGATPERAPAFLALYASCRQIDGNCAEALDADPVQAVAWVNSEQWILDRYLALLDHGAWSEARPFDPELPLAPYNAALDMQRLFFVHAWITAGKGEAQAVADLLQRDLAFWRMVLASSDNFTAKRAATVAINRHFTWSSLVMRSMPPEQRLQAIPPAWRTALSAPERAILRNAASEFQTLRRSVMVVKNKHRAGLWAPLEKLNDRLFQVQHTLNPHADALVATADAFGADYARLPQAASALAGARTDGDDVVDSWLYNLAGRSLPGPRMHEVVFFASRVADLEALRRAALLTAQLRSDDPEPAAMAGKVAASALRNPYTGKPFVWDEQMQAVRFAGISPPPYNEYVVYY